MIVGNARFLPRRIARAAIAGLALLAAGCASSGTSLDAGDRRAEYQNEIGVFENPAADTAGRDPVADAAYWSVRYDQNPNDWQAAVRYSAALRKIGSTEQAVRVIVGVSQQHGQEPDVAFETGKALIEAGRGFEAVRHLETALAARPRDWRILSAYGVALDYIGEHKLARSKYDIALTAAPGSATLMNNKALSYALSGNLAKAAHVLRAAANAPGGDARVRQNLALVLAIKGDMMEAERLARSDLPPQIADQNVNYYRSLVVQPSYWQEFGPDTVDAPTFTDYGPADPAPVAPAAYNTPADLTKTTPAETPTEKPRMAPTGGAFDRETPQQPAAQTGEPSALFQPAPVETPATEAEAPNAPVGLQRATPPTATSASPIDDIPLIEMETLMGQSPDASRPVNPTPGETSSNDDDAPMPELKKNAY